MRQNAVIVNAWKILTAALLLLICNAALKAADKPPQAPPVERAAKVGCPNCSICGTGYTSGMECPCFGGGYYCADGKCYIQQDFNQKTGAKPPQAPPVERPAVAQPPVIYAAPVVAAPVPFVQDRSTGVATTVQRAATIKGSSPAGVQYGAPTLIPAPVMGRSGITNCPPGQT